MLLDFIEAILYAAACGVLFFVCWAGMKGGDA